MTQVFIEKYHALLLHALSCTCSANSWHAGCLQY